MKKYIAKLVFNIQVKDGVNQSQFDEQLRLIEATTSADAFLKARMLGEKEQTIFKNATGENVNWKFIDVSDIQLLNSLNDGTEIYSFTREEEDSKDYINFIRRKAQVLQIREMAFA